MKYLVTGLLLVAVLLALVLGGRQAKQGDRERQLAQRVEILLAEKAALTIEAAKCEWRSK